VTPQALAMAEVTNSGEVCIVSKEEVTGAVKALLRKSVGSSEVFLT
jgi:hypothetical protein